jgi:SAM-dependent methyltransferase
MREQQPHLNPQLTSEQASLAATGDQAATKILYSQMYGIMLEHDKRGVFPNLLREPQRDLFKQKLAHFRIPDDATVVEVGCGLGHLHVCHPNWRGFEYSDQAVKLGKARYGEKHNLSEGDARALPLESDSVDFLASFDALEHIPDVEKAFAEICRIIKPGGVGFLMPAWNCRSWAVKKLGVRPYSELSLSEKIGKFLIPLRDNLYFRLLCGLPARLGREIRLLFGAKDIALEYRKLSPDFSLWTRYDHAADDDAFASIDAHAALAYFVSRGWKTPSHPTAWKRFSCRGEAILVQKPA